MRVVSCEVFIVRNLLIVVSVVAVLLGCTKKSDDQLNTLHLVTVNKIKGLDPVHAEDRYSGLEVLRVYEGLFQYHPFKRPYELEPLLAEKFPEFSKDGLKVTFTIRKGVLFQDDAAFPNGKGREVKASDFVYSWKRLADPRIKAMGWWILENHIQGMDEWHEALSKDKENSAKIFEEEISGLKAIGDYQLQVTLKRPYPQFLNILSMPYTTVVAREVVEKYGQEFMNHAVGTGAFMLTSYQPNSVLEYKKNPNFREMLFPSEGAPGEKEAGLLADAGKRLPFVDAITVRIIEEAQPRWLHFLKGELDLIVLPKDDFAQAVKRKDESKAIGVGNIELTDELSAKNIKLVTAVAFDLTYTAINNASVEIPQLKDKRVRQAISLALDYAEAIKIFYNNMAVPAQSPIPPGLSGYDPDYKNPYRTARMLLADAGYPGGKGFPEIPFDSISSTTERQIAEYAVKQLDRLGLRVKLVSSSWPQMLQRVNNRQAQMWDIAWGADYPDAENFLQLFYSANAQSSGSNQSYYKNKAFDQLFEKARLLPDSPERSELYRQMAKIVAEDCPVVFGVHRFAITLLQGWIQNYRYDDSAYPRSKYIRIDADLKKSHK